MANSSSILSHVLKETPISPHPITYQWLLPNIKGLETFLQTLGPPSSVENHGYMTPPPSPSLEDQGPALNTSSQDPNAMPSSTSGAAAMTSPPKSTHEISIFLAATESFSKKNTNCSVAESIERFAPVFSTARDRNLSVRAYISVALGCPFEGPDVDPHRVADLAVKLLEMGADEISVADTTGMGTAPKTGKLLQTLREAGVRTEDIALHFHDTFGQALVNTVVSG